MDGFSFAKDGERAIGCPPRPPTPTPTPTPPTLFPPSVSPGQSSAGAPSRAPSQGSRLFSPPDSTDHPSDLPAWVLDHEAIAAWLREIPSAQRPALLARLGSHIDSIRRSQLGYLEPDCGDAVLSYAILIEYAEHLGVSPMDVCWTFEQGQVENFDALLGVRVDRMLRDARAQRSSPRRPGSDAAQAPRSTRGLSDHWRASAGRRGRRTDERRRGPEPDHTPPRRTDAGRAG